MTDTTRLSRTVLPTSYDLEIETDADATAFWGQVTIAVSITETTSSIVLNVRDLTVDLVAIRQYDEAVNAELFIDAASEQLEVRTARPLDVAPATLVLRFAGDVSGGLLGYYRSTFVDESGTQRVLAATQFEAPHARRAFPCFDEPEFKAVFAITLVLADGLLAICSFIFCCISLGLGCAMCVATIQM